MRSRARPRRTRAQKSRQYRQWRANLGKRSMRPMPGWLRDVPPLLNIDGMPGLFWSSREKRVLNIRDY